MHSPAGSVQVAIAGVTRKIVQPFLGGAEDYVTASELHLSLEEFEEAGSIAAGNERLLGELTCHSALN